MKITRAFWFLLAACAIGCGDDDDEGGTSSPLVQSCHSLCEAQYATCPDSTTGCRETCNALASQFTGDCAHHAQAYYDCGAKIAWTCENEIASQVDSTQCKTELDAYSACFTR